MLCKHPIKFRKISDSAAFPCGQCIACRVNKRRVWSHRIVLESMAHQFNSFLTLTYADENLPGEYYDPKTGQLYSSNSVVVEHHRLFMYRLRTVVRRKLGISLRFFMVAEYGEKTGRPHYHYILFGYPFCQAGKKSFGCRCGYCQLVQSCWNYGHIFLGDCNLESANYVAGYVNKKMTSDSTKFQQDYLNGRRPEFTRMSNRPGIGYAAAVEIARNLTNVKKTSIEDVPVVLSHGKKKLPLGRYLTGKLHEILEIDTSEKLLLYEQSLSDLLKNPKYDKEKITFAQAQGAVDIALEYFNKQKVANLESKFNNNKERKKL